MLKKRSSGTAQALRATLRHDRPGEAQSTLQGSFNPCPQAHSA